MDIATEIFKKFFEQKFEMFRKYKRLNMILF